jgi:hypothetical protein
MDKWLNRATNFAVIIVAVVATYSYSTRATDRVAPGSAAATEYRAGDKINTDGLNLSGRTLLLVTKSTCRFCTESMGLYRRFPKDLKVIAITPESPDTNRDYLRSNAVHFDSILRLEQTRLRINATPVLLHVEAGDLCVSYAGLAFDGWQQSSSGRLRDVRLHQ